MALFNVTNLFDSGVGSLRQAILDSNAMAGADTIQFSGVTGTITLTRGELSITDNLTINGPGANNFSVSGNNNSRVFYIYNPSTTIDVFIDGLTITRGIAFFAGGIFNREENLTLSNSTVSRNLSSYGGGVLNSNGTTSISNSTISGNLANDGGGVLNSNGITSISNSTISNNSAYYGGGVSNSYGTTSISNSTVSGNLANDGGGVFNRGTLNLANTIIANSTGGDCATFGLDTNVNNLIEDGSCDPTLSGNPNLGPLQDNGGPTFTQALLPGSIAIDAGSNAAIPPGITTDQRGAGFSRIVNGTVDIGAYEASPNVPPVPEPSSLFGILTLGLVAIGSLRRRRK
ncbi:PEP-CTERM sorting domain-containing protein [Chroococcus sp. FPU101]|uniref:PEP-CTERM sorting domain-containing protein n=1 Tax=Chroococcus sp. FPU101 TaxID=1974212 RepID=UPI001A8FA095|nr:PEP-CTERM sorting domain-containing protein [Chroococcus sp. FPU101]